jgi:hypothetical protein
MLQECRRAPTQINRDIEYTAAQAAHPFGLERGLALKVHAADRSRLAGQRTVDLDDRAAGVDWVQQVGVEQAGKFTAGIADRPAGGDPYTRYRGLPGKVHWSILKRWVSHLGKWLSGTITQLSAAGLPYLHSVSGQSSCNAQAAADLR